MIKLPAYLTGFSSHTDGSAGIRFTTNEIGADEYVSLRNGLNKFGYMLFNENSFSEDDIPKEQAENTNKTPSKRLRSTLFIFWQQQGSKGNFETFYADQMEKIITFVKDKLE